MPDKHQPNLFIVLGLYRRIFLLTGLNREVKGFFQSYNFTDIIHTANDPIKAIGGSVSVSPIVFLFTPKWIPFVLLSMAHGRLF